MELIKYKRTVIGWYNFDDVIFKYNVDPVTFRRLTEVSDKATAGIAEVTTEELAELKESARHTRLIEDWGIVQSDAIYT